MFEMVQDVAEYFAVMLRLLSAFEDADKVADSFRTPMCFQELTERVI